MPKSFKDFLSEGKLIITVTSNDPSRMFFSGTLKAEHLTWLTKHSEGTEHVSVTVDLDHTTMQARMNRIDSAVQGRGYGSEILEFVHKTIKRKGFTKITAYIEHDNFRSQELFKKRGYKEIRRADHGAYYEKIL